MTIWKKYTSTADKNMLVNGNKHLSTFLAGRKELDLALSASSNLRELLLGDFFIIFNTFSDKVVSLSGSTLVSLNGTKQISTLIGELSTTTNLLGDASYSKFPIYCDTTYVTFDYVDITWDNR